MRYDFYQAEHPWGPWSLIDSHSDSFLVDGHMYGPSLCSRFQRSAGGEVKISMFTSGRPFPDVPSGIYKMREISVVLRTDPLPTSRVVPADDPTVKYKGSWRAVEDSVMTTQHARWTHEAGGSAELSFEGTGVSCMAEKGHGLGRVDVYLDGKKRRNVSLGIENFPRMTGVEVFAESGLQPGPHTVKVVATSGLPVVLNGLRIEG